MMSLTFGLFTQVSGSGPLGPLVCFCLSSGWPDSDRNAVSKAGKPKDNQPTRIRLSQRAEINKKGNIKHV